MKRIFKYIFIIVLLNIIFFEIGLFSRNKVEAATPSVTYISHVQDRGWLFWQSDGGESGTPGKNRRLEAFRIKLNNANGLSISYQAHVQDIGWQGVVRDGTLAGTTGQSKRVEAMKITLSNTSNYDVTYRAYVQNIGWMNWVKNGEVAGTTGRSLRIEAYEVKLVPKTATSNTNSSSTTSYTTNSSLSYSTHVQDIGWQNYVSQNQLAGTTGQSKRIEALKINSNLGITYRAHVQDIGWQNWVSNNQIAGTTGKSKRVEAIQIKLNDTSNYDIQYQVHVQNIGWMNWVKNGEVAGTTGRSLRIEAIRIKLVAKANTSANTNTSSSVSNVELNSLDTNKYPGYKERLQAVAKAHPNWSFKFLKTGLTFDEAVKGEASVRNRNLVPRKYSGEWITSTQAQDSGSWYCASQKAIGIYMDPRNFLDDINIFQFLNVKGFNGCTIQGIKNKTNGTWLNDYAQDIYNACKAKDVNAYYIIARLLQEQGSGSSGGSTIRMTDSDGKNYYNPFNIGATGNDIPEIIKNALAKAKSNGWNTMEKSLEGGIEFCNKNWLNNHQNTLYQNKFDIYKDNTALYSHQYMQNLLGATSEALTLHDTYAKTNALNSKFTFIIPLYEKMPTTYSPKIVHTTTDSINVRNSPSTATRNFADIMVHKGSWMISLQSGCGADKSWSLAISNIGLVGYISTQFIK